MKALFTCLAALFAIAIADQEKVAAPVIKDIARNYRQMRAITTQPVEVDPGFAVLCAPPPPEWVADAKKKNGPHALSRILVFMNERGAEAFEKVAKEFPVGSVIVKEKRGAADGVGGMVKRPPGYDPDHGDWEFFYFGVPTIIKSGKIASCIQCHDGASRDHVFGDWAKEK
jgi:hypothetical protein